MYSDSLQSFLWGHTHHATVFLFVLVFFLFCFHRWFNLRMCGWWKRRGMRIPFQSPRLNNNRLRLLGGRRAATFLAFARTFSEEKRNKGSTRHLRVIPPSEDHCTTVWLPTGTRATRREMMSAMLCKLWTVLFLSLQSSSLIHKWHQPSEKKPPVRRPTRQTPHPADAPPGCGEPIFTGYGTTPRQHNWMFYKYTWLQSLKVTDMNH